MSGITRSVTRSIYGEQPKYNQSRGFSSQEKAAQLQQKYGIYGVDSPLGGVNLVQNPDGTYTQQFTQSAADEQRNALIGQGLSGISLDPTQAQDAYYQQATRLLTPQFERQQERLDTNLINRGIGVGTEQYSQALEDLQNQQAGTLSDIANQSVFAGQDLLGSQISNIGSLTGQRDIGALSALRTPTGASFQETYTPRYNSNLRNYQTEQQQMSQLAQFGAMLSDKRLKENLVKVGKLDNGLDIYIGNYNDNALELDDTLTKKPQLFLIAQEVKEVNPEAVIEKDGYLAVNYMEAVK